MPKKRAVVRVAIFSAVQHSFFQRFDACRLDDRRDVGIDFVNLTGDFLERGPGIRDEGDTVCDMETGGCDQALYLLGAFADRCASSRTSWATTAKPSPASPARAAFQDFSNAL